MLQPDDTCPVSPSGPQDDRSMMNVRPAADGLGPRWSKSLLAVSASVLMETCRRHHGRPTHLEEETCSR